MYRRGHLFRKAVRGGRLYTKWFSANHFPPSGVQVAATERHGELKIANCGHSGMWERLQVANLPEQQSPAKLAPTFRTRTSMCEATACGRFFGRVAGSATGMAKNGGVANAGRWLRPTHGGRRPMFIRIPAHPSLTASQLPNFVFLHACGGALAGIFRDSLLAQQAVQPSQPAPRMPLSSMECIDYSMRGCAADEESFRQSGRARPVREFLEAAIAHRRWPPTLIWVVSTSPQRRSAAPLAPATERWRSMWSRRRVFSVAARPPRRIIDALHIRAAHTPANRSDIEDDYTIVQSSSHQVINHKFPESSS